MTIQRTLVLDGNPVPKVEDARPLLNNQFDVLKDLVKELIELPGPAVKLSATGLREVHAFMTSGGKTRPTDRGAMVAILQFSSHGAWTSTATTGIAAKKPFGAFNTAPVMRNLGELGKFLRANPNVRANLAAAGVGFELSSAHKDLGSEQGGTNVGFGGGAVINERIHIAEWVLAQPGEGFMRMVVHEAGHATFQRMLLTGVNWSNEANRGREKPDDAALEADGKTFYAAWEVLRNKPQHFFITAMPGSSASATRAGRGSYLAGEFSEFCAESFMHLALEKAELLKHVANLPDEEPEVKKAWQSALAVLLKHESQVLGSQAGAGPATLKAHKNAPANQAFAQALARLKSGLEGPNLDTSKPLPEVKADLLSLREAWRALPPEDQARHRGTALSALDEYVMRVQRRRPAQEHLLSELGFANV